jgi:hypothetical protein
VGLLPVFQISPVRRPAPEPIDSRTKKLRTRLPNPNHPVTSPVQASAAGQDSVVSGPSSPKAPSEPMSPRKGGAAQHRR